MSDFAINGVINVVTTGVDKALAEVEAVEARLKAQRGALVQEIVDGADVKRIKAINREVNAIDRELKDVKLQSRAVTYGLEGMDPALRKALISADKFNRVSQNMVDNFKGGNFGDPNDLQYFRELARSADGLEDMRRALAAAEITGATVPQSLRRVVQEADKFEESFGRAVQSMKDFDSVNATRGMDELTRAMVRYNEAEARRDQANRDSKNKALPHYDRELAAASIARYNQEMLDADRDFIRESDRLDAEAGRKREKADRDEMARRKANAQAHAMIAREEIAANKARVDAENTRITEQARFRAFEAREEAAVRAAREKFLAQDEAYHERVSNLQRNLGYAQMAETVDQEAVARTRLADATRDATRAQTAYNVARDAGDEDGMVRTRKLHTDALQRQVTAQNDLSRAIQFNNGLASQNRYAMYDAAQTYALLAAAPAAAIIGLGGAAGWWESQMTAIARTTGVLRDAPENLIPGGEAMEIVSRQMTRMGDAIPVWVGRMTEIAKIGGQLDVPARDIASFTGVISQFQAVSDVTDPGEISEAFGRIASLRGTTDYRMIADAIANVGVNAAATDAQIIKTTQELAQAGAGANFTTEEIIGMAGGFASLGVPAERARSVMQDFVRIATGGLSGANDSMTKFGNVMGITAQEAQSLFRQNPADFITKFAKGLSSLSPEDVVTTLQDIGLKGQRAAPVFQALAKDARNAGEGMSVWATAIDNARNSQGALTEQFGPQMDDLASSWQRFLNTFVTTAAVTGAGIGPVLGGVLDSISDFMKGWRSFASSGIGQFFIGLAASAGTAATAFFGLRAAVAAAAGMGLALQAVNRGAGGSFMGQLKTAGSVFVPFSAGANQVATSTTKAANATAGMGRATKAATVGVNEAAAATSRYNSRVGEVHHGMNRMQRGLHGLSSAARTAGASLSGALGGPVGVVAVASLAAAAGISALADSGKASNAELSSLLATSKSIVPVVDRAFSRDWAGNIGQALQGTIGAPLLWGARAILDPRAMEIPNFTQGLDASTGNFFEWMTLTPGQRMASEGVDQIAQSIGDLASYDLPAAQRAMADLRQQYGLTDADMLKFIRSNETLNGVMLDAARIAGVNIGALETLAETQALVNFSEGADAAGTNGGVVEGIDNVSSAIQSQITLQQEGLTTLNANTSAMGAYYQAMEGVGAVVEEYANKYGSAVDIWDSSRGVWNITNSDTAALAMTFENLAASTLTAVSAMETSGATVDELNDHIGDARSAISGYLTQLGVDATTIESILSDLGLSFIEHEFTMTVDGVSESITGVAELANRVKELPKGTTITVESLTDDAKSGLEELGIHAQQLADGTWRLSVALDGDAVFDDVATLISMMEGLEAGTEIRINNPSDRLLEYLDSINAKVQTLDDGSIVVTVELNDPDGVLDEDGPLNGKNFKGRRAKWAIDLVAGDNWATDIQTIHDYITSEFDWYTTAEVEVILNDAEAQLSIGQWIEGSNGDIIFSVDADVLTALSKIEGLKIVIDSTTGEVTVYADTEAVAEKLEEVIEMAEGRNANIHFNPDMDDVLEAINEATKSRDVEVEGIPQMSAAERAITRTSRPRPMTITANANVGEAERLLNRTARNRPTNISVSVSGGAAADGYLNSIARDRTSTITVNVNTNHHTTYSSSGSSGGGQSPIVTGPNSADGGYTGAGPKWAFAGNVHAGEYVIPKRDVDQTTGLPRADALARLMGQAGAMGGPQVIVQQGSGGGIMELGPTSIHAIARAVQPMLKMDSSVIAQGVSSQFANNTRKGAY